MTRTGIICCLLLACVLPAGADDRKPSALPTDVAGTVEAVLAARTDTPRLAALAGRAKPDAFRVATALCNRGEFDAADRFATAAPCPMLDQLPAYVQARRAGADDEVAKVQATYERGLAHTLGGRYPEAQSDLEASRKAADAIGWKRHAVIATRKIGDTWFGRGEHEKAIGIYAKSVALAQAIGDQAQESLALHNRGQMNNLIGRHEASLADFEAALAIERTLGDPVGLAYELTSVAHVRVLLHDYATGLALLDEALTVVPPPTTPDTKKAFVVTMHHAAWASQLTGDYAHALSHYRAILGIIREWGDAKREVEILENIAYLSGQLGDLSARIESTREALVIRSRQKDRYGVAQLHTQLGGVQQALGQMEASVAAYERAHTAFETLLKEAEAAGDPDKVLDILHNLSVAASNLGRRDEAIKHALTAIEIARKRESKYALRLLLRQVGRARHQSGKAEAAIAPLEEALEIARGEEVVNEAAVTDLVSHLGQAHYGLKQDEQAAAHFTDVLARTKDTLTLALRASTYTWLGRIAFRAERHQEALGHLQAAGRLVDQISSGLAEGEGGGARDQYVDLYHMGIRSAGVLEDPATMAWFLERSRAASLREAFVHREALLAALPARLRDPLFSARGRQRASLAAYRYARQSGRRSDIRKARVAYDADGAALRQAVARIQREAKSAAALALPEPDSLEQLQAQLEPTDAMVVYWHGWDQSINALVVRKDSARALTITSSIDLDDRIDSFYGDPEKHVNPGALEGLRAHLAGSLSLGKDVKRVLVSPMGRMAYVPFSLLFPNKLVAMVPSGTTYGLLREDRALRGTKVLGVGDPDYGTVVHQEAIALHRGSALARLAPLPATRAEVEAVSDVQMLGLKATESGLLAALKTETRWRAVHFACHGLVDPRRPAFSSLALTADAKHDGFLTCLDVGRMKIPADLVVLSACDTARGKIYKTEGIAGLTRAFMLAGAPRVICSLWKVDDEATKALMIEFYKQWNKQGLGAAAALKHAQEYISTHPKHPEWKHPYYWAAWVLWGLPD